MHQLRQPAPAPSPQFVRTIRASIDHWRAQTETITAHNLHALDEERRNLYQALRFGLMLPQAGRAAARTVFQSFDLIEQRGYWREWLPLLEAAIAACPPAQWALRCRLLNQLGILHRYEHRVAEAIDTHRQAEALLQERQGSGAARQQAQQLLAETIYHLSADYLAEQAYGETTKLGEQALALFEETGSEARWRAAVLTVLGQTAYRQGELGRARRQLARAAELRREIGQPVPLARVLSDLALVVQAQGELKGARAHLREAATLLAPTINEMDKSLIQQNLGFTYASEERWAEAETAFRRANSAYLRRFGRLGSRARAATNLGYALLMQQQMEAADSYLRQALTLWQETGNEIELANALGNLGELCLARGEGEKAAGYYREGMVLLERHPDNAWARRLLAEFVEQVAGAA